MPRLILECGIASRDCCHGQKKIKTTHKKKLTIPFFRSRCPNPPPELRKAQRPAIPSFLARVSIKHKRSRPNLWAQRTKEISRLQANLISGIPRRKGYLSPFLPDVGRRGEKNCSLRVNNSKNNSLQREGTSCLSSDTWRLHFHVCLLPSPHLCSFSCSNSGACVQEAGVNAFHYGGSAL
ncbi:hypothetical protein CEXT_562961 [Caerostris extrusa]|uniref:Uncharacterized protein n=1 Tax=Caerostris extrusa TaxID=172846 RepID=A0AAV4WNY4_CAEEX|nr:hypothetical protein CEXT_562961 [Caerostris extrusa]